MDVKPSMEMPAKKVEEKKEQWAIKVDVNSPVADFYKRIPDMAYKVTLTTFPAVTALQYNKIQSVIN